MKTGYKSSTPTVQSQQCRVNSADAVQSQQGGSSTSASGEKCSKGKSPDNIL